MDTFITITDKANKTFNINTRCICYYYYDVKYNETKITMADGFVFTIVGNFTIGQD